MKITYTKSTLEKIESLFKGLGYRLRFEKGNFKTGICIMAHDKIIVINKFSTLESKINALIGMIQNIQLSEEPCFDEKQKQFFLQLQQKQLVF